MRAGAQARWKSLILPEELFYLRVALPRNRPFRVAEEVAAQRQPRDDLSERAEVPRRTFLRPFRNSSIEKRAINSMSCVAELCTKISI